MEAFKNIKFKNGNSMPSVGLGCWKIDQKVTAQTVYSAIKNGYRCIDEACDYGNEKQAGEGIKQAISEGIVKREELFVTSKLWNTYHRKEHVELACRKSLEDLGLDYIDLYLVHFPIAIKFVPFEKCYPPEWVNLDTMKMEEDKVSLQETWTAMEALLTKGLVKNIGICNVGTTTLRDILNFCTIQPSVLQIELHPYLTQERLLRLCKDKGVAVTGFSCLGGTSYVEIGGSTVEEGIMNNGIIIDLAKKYNKSPAQICFRWGIQRGYQVIPKSIKEERQKENINIFDFNISDDDMKQINALNKNKRFNDPGAFCEEAFGLFFPIFD